MRELCEVTDVKLKSVWDVAFNGTLFLKRKHHVTTGLQLHTVKYETDG